MKPMFSKVVALACWMATCGISSIAQASTYTLTFDDQSPNPIVEQGFSYTNNSSFSPPGTLGLSDDVGPAYQQSVNFTNVAGARFNANSYDISGSQRLFRTGSQAALDAGGTTYFDWTQTTKIPFLNYVWNGYRDGILVASQAGNVDDWFNLQTYSFGSVFNQLTSLQLQILYPTGVPLSPPITPNTTWCNQWCADVALDNLVLSPVPLPASLPMLAAGLVGLGFLRRKRKSCWPGKAPAT